MPLQNRVSPFGDIISDQGRGLFMGNRGILHGNTRTLAKARWRHAHWIICLTSFKSRRRTVMTPGKYTELFFSDEASALAAGHRPCAECRRAAYNDFRSAWQIGHDLEHQVGANEMDRVLHRQRVNKSDRRQITYRAPLSSLPDGAFFSLTTDSGTAILKYNNQLWEWSFAGYTPLGQIPLRDEMVDVRTPQSIIRTLAAGYTPVFHPNLTGKD